MRTDYILNLSASIGVIRGEKNSAKEKRKMRPLITQIYAPRPSNGDVGRCFARQIQPSERALVEKKSSSEQHDHT